MEFNTHPYHTGNYWDEMSANYTSELAKRPGGNFDEIVKKITSGPLSAEQIADRDLRYYFDRQGREYTQQQIDAHNRPPRTLGPDPDGKPKKPTGRNLIPLPDSQVVKPSAIAAAARTYYSGNAKLHQGYQGIAGTVDPKAKMPGAGRTYQLLNVGPDARLLQAFIDPHTGGWAYDPLNQQLSGHDLKHNMTQGRAGTMAAKGQLVNPPMPKGEGFGITRGTTGGMPSGVASKSVGGLAVLMAMGEVGDLEQMHKRRQITEGQKAAMQRDTLAHYGFSFTPVGLAAFGLGAPLWVAGQMPGGGGGELGKTVMTLKSKKERDIAGISNLELYNTLKPNYPQLAEMLLQGIERDDQDLVNRVLIQMPLNTEEVALKRREEAKEWAKETERLKGSKELSHFRSNMAEGKIPKNWGGGFGGKMTIGKNTA